MNERQLAVRSHGNAWDDLDYLDQCEADAKAAVGSLINSYLVRFGHEADQDTIGHIDDLVTDAFYQPRKELKAEISENAWSQPTAYQEHGTWSL